MFDKKVQEMLTEIMFEEKAEKWVKDNLHSTEEDYNKAFIDGAKFGYNEKHSELEIELKWERDTKSELADHLGKANDRVADLEDKLANADYQIEGRDLEIKELEAQIEKMKCCANCMYEPPFDKHCDNCIRGSIKLKYMNWQLRR